MSGKNPSGFVLAGDIGGTKTSLGLFSPGERRPALEVMKSYPSREAYGLEELVATFLAEHPCSISRACFGIAGPVIRGVTKTTNLPWVASEEEIKKRFGWDKVWLINDLSATALAVPVLEPSEVRELNAGAPEVEGAIGLVAPGTGLGMALMVVVSGRYYPIPSEGGHVEFAPTSDLQMELLRYLLSRMPHVSVERLASGPGLFTIYSWLRDHRAHAEPRWLTERLNAEDPSKVVSAAGLLQEDPVCAEALDLFISIIGAAAGNLALSGMTTGGMYLGGGVCPKILPRLEQGTFMKAFVAKGRFQGLLSSMPVRVILNEQAALLGAACRGLES
jgi:glucokinase